MGYHEDLFRLYKFADPKGYRNLRKTSRRRDNVLLDSGCYSTTALGRIKQMSKGFKIAKSQFDMNKMLYYVKGIRRLQSELQITVSEFPELGLFGRITVAEQEQKLPCYAKKQIEIENCTRTIPF
jgi:hypothetical protein